MPGGLAGVEQIFTADASGYVSAIGDMIKANKGLVESVGEMQRTVAGVQGALKGAAGGGAADDIAKANAAIREQLNSLGDLGRAHTQVTGAVGSHAGAVTGLGASYEAARARINAMAADALRVNADMAAGFERQIDLAGRTASQYDASREKVRGFTSEVSGLRTEIEKTATSAAQQGESLVQFWRRVSPDGSGGSGGGGSAAKNAIYDAMNSWGPQGGGGGGGGGGFVPILGGGGGGGGGGYDFGTALRQYDATATFLKRWYSFAHYAVMGANEILATVGPAAVAGITGAYVGLEGGQTAYDRIKAINAVGQSLGSGSPGQTPGQLLGLGDSLQKAQTAADPQVWELLGAGINSVRAATDNANGGLSSFWQLGTNTIHMVDEFAASVTQAFQGGAGKQLQALVSGGTNDLKQFGDVFGNLGQTFLHMAPALPGVGGDYLSILQGATRALSVTTGAIPTTGLGFLLGGEAAMRLGGPVVGGAARLLGKVPGLGSVARAATADDVAAGLAGAEGETIAGEGLAGALGATSAPGLFALGAAAYGIGKTVTAQTPAQQLVSQRQGLINQANFTQGLHQLATGIFEAAGAGTAGPKALDSNTGIMAGIKQQLHGNILLGTKDIWSSLSEKFLGTGGVQTPAGTNAAAVQQWTRQFQDVQKTAQDIAKTFGVSLPEAFALADQAGLQVGDNLDKKTGQLNDKSKTMIQNTLTGYQAMNASAGVMYKNVGAVQVAQGLQGTQLATVNSAWDQLVQNAAGGTSAATGFAGSIGAVKGAASPQAIAKALTGFTSRGSQAAWNAFSSTSTSAPGLIQQANSMMDWLRTAQTSGALTQGQASAAGMYEARQLLPYAKRSPAALAQLGILSQEAGGPAYDTSKSQAQNYAAISSAIDKAAASGKNFNKIMTAGTIGMSDVSKQAQTFGASMKSDVYDAMEKGSVSASKITADMQRFTAGVSHGNLSGVKALAQDFAAAKASAGDISTILGTVLSGKGLNTSQIKTIVGSVQSAVAGINAKIKVTADASQLKTLQSEVNALHGKNINVAVYANAHPVQTLQAAMSGLVNKTVTVTVREVHDYINVVHNQLGVPTSVAAGVAPGFLLSHGHFGGLVTARGIARYQTGGMVPGSGSGDIIPAMLEPGEAIIPRYLVPLISPILAAHRVPGFGGMPQSSSSHFAAGGVAGGGSTPWLPYWEYEAKKKGWSPPAAHPVTGGTATSAVTDAAKQFTFTLTGEIAKQVQNSAGAKKIADELIARLGKEVALAKNVSSAAMSGQGYGNAGLLGGFDVTPGTGNGTVQEQMQSYLGSVKSFTKDIATLRKDHLNKAVISQLIGAGPVQGDALAQSILGGYGGVKSVNSLWSQLGGATKGLGAQAAMAQFGGHLSPDLKSGSVSIGGINININASGGTTLALTTAQINQITAKVQAALLKQAKRNNKTGIQQAGKGA